MDSGQDGLKGEDAPAEKLYTAPENMLEVAHCLGSVDSARFLPAAIFAREG